MFASKWIGNRLCKPCHARVALTSPLAPDWSIRGELTRVNPSRIKDR